MEKSLTQKILLALLDNLIWVFVIIAIIAFWCLERRIYILDPASWSWTQIVLNVSESKFLDPTNLLKIIPSVAALALLVIGQSFTMLTGHFDLSAESNIGLTAMVAGSLIATTELGGLGIMMSAEFAILIMLLVGIGVGLLNGLMVTRLKMNNLIVTIAMLIFLRGVIYIISPYNRGLPTSSASQLGDTFNWLGGGTLFTIPYGDTVLEFPVSIVFVILCFIIAHIVTRYTQFGRNMYAVGSNRDAAEAAGIRSDRVILMVYIISGLCAALAGWLIAGRMDAASPRTGDGWIFQIQAAAIVGGVSLAGGRGTMVGALGGVLLWGILQNGLPLAGADPFTVNVALGGLLLFAMLLDAIKVRYLNRVALRKTLEKTSIGLEDSAAYV